MSVFTSVFASRLEGMLDYRVACGFRRETYIPSLIKFDKYCNLRLCDEPNLTSELVHGWLEQDAATGIYGKVLAIRQFGKYLCAISEEAYILPEKFSPSRRAHAPYVFTDNEMASLFAAIDRLKGTRSEPHLGEIAPVIFRLIYTCGLRPNEGRELLRRNVNIDSGEILITNTKKNKERIVVMSDDMLSLCRSYDLRRGIFGGASPYFFPSATGEALTNTVLYATFNKAWREAVSVLGNPTAKSVRVYDLRHRFASACLNRWLDDGENLNAMLPYLRTYMGHGCLDETAYYIHILPENLVKSSAIEWSAFNDMFPEVTS